MTLVEELDLEALVLGLGDGLAFVGVDHEVLGSIDQDEVLGSLHDQVDCVFHIEHKRTGPVHYVVDVALGGSAHDQMVVPHAHVDHALAEVKVLIHLVQAVVHADLVVFIEHCFDMGPGELAVHDVSKDHRSVATSTRANSAVVRPGEGHHRAGVGFVEAVRPAGLVAEAEHLEGAHSEELT